MFDAVARVSDLLAERHMTYAELSRRSGISSSTLRTAAARKTQLSLSVIEQICAALDIPLWKFFMPDGANIILIQHSKTKEYRTNERNKSICGSKSIV